jgi:sulfate permease, SulP family
MPGWLTTYRSTWLRSDLVAGLATAAVVIPQSMAYAAIAGLPVEVGLYSASVPMAAYALAGTSRALSVSVSSSIAAITAVAVSTTPDPRAAATTLALLSGVVLIMASVIRLGFVADLISAPVLAGFKVGIGLSIAAGQLDSLLGVPIPSDRFVGQLWQALTLLPQASVPTLLLSAACVAVLLAGKRWLRAVPAALVVVVVAIAITWIGHLDRYGIALIDPVPSGLPLPALPTLTSAAALLGPALGVALITFVESIAAARTFERRDDRPVSANRELGALGLANMIASLLRGMPAGGGMSQTAVNDGAGAKSPAAAVVTAAMVMITLLFLAPLFSKLPQAALGALVFAAAVGLVDIRTVRTIFVVQRRDGVLCLLAAVGVIALGALDGILIAVGISALTLLYESSRRPLEVVDAVSPEQAPIPVPVGLLVLRLHSELHFANVHRFRREARAAIAAAPAPPSVVVFDASRLGSFEYTANESARGLIEELTEQGIEVWTVVPPGQITDAINRFTVISGAEEIRTFPNPAAAVAAFAQR